MIDSHMCVAINVGIEVRVQTGRAYLTPTTFQPVALSVLRRMLDREYVSEHVTPSETLADPTSEVMVSGLKAVAALGTVSVEADLRGPVERLADTDENLTVRQAAMETLGALDGTPFEGNVAER